MDDDVFAGLRWGLRRYAALVAAVLTLAVVGALTVTDHVRQRAPYTATALVVATTLEIRPEQLPRFGESVFRAGSVARAVAAAQPTTDFRTLVDERISVDPVPDTIAFRVHGHSADPQEATALANAAAAAFVTQLNRAGVGVGTFSLQDPAFVPLDRTTTAPSPLLAALVGLAAGSVIAVALVALIVGTRRPVLSAEGAATAVGAPLIARVMLPTLAARRRGEPPRGLRTLLTSLLEIPTPVVELSGPLRAQPALRELLRSLHATRDREALRPVTSPAGNAPAGQRMIALADTDDDTAPPLVMPADEPPATPEGSPFSVVVVVPRGTSARAVADVVAGFPDEEVVGTVFVVGPALQWMPGSGPSQATEPADVEKAAARNGTAPGASASRGQHVPVGSPAP